MGRPPHFIPNTHSHDTTSADHSFRANTVAGADGQTTGASDRRSSSSRGAREEDGAPGPAPGE